MDELIRELERRASEARRRSEQAPQFSPLQGFLDGQAAAHEETVTLTKQAKVLMSAREPAWDVQ